MKRWDTGTAPKHYEEGACFPAIWCHRARFLKAGHLAFLWSSGACRKEPQHLTIEISYRHNPYREGLTAQVCLTKLQPVSPSQLLQRQKTITTQQFYWCCVCQLQPVCRLANTERGSCRACPPQLPVNVSSSACKLVLFSTLSLHRFSSPQVRKWKK